MVTSNNNTDTSLGHITAAKIKIFQYSKIIICANFLVLVSVILLSTINYHVSKNITVYFCILSTVYSKEYILLYLMESLVLKILLNLSSLHTQKKLRELVELSPNSQRHRQINKYLFALKD